MPFSARNMMRGTLALVLALTVALPAMAAPAMAASDDDIPGVPIPASPIAGDLDGVADVHDVYAISLTQGDRITATLTGADGTDFDLSLYGLGATSVDANVPLAYSGTGTYPEQISYDIPMSGVYYLDADALFSGPGTYTIDYSVGPGVMPEADRDIPGVTLPASPFSGSLDALADQHDVNKVHLLPGQKLIAQLTGDAGTDFDLYLFGPSATSVITAAPVRWSTEAKYPELIAFTATEEGDYYLDLFALDGAGGYTVSYTIQNGVSLDGDGDVPGKPLPVSHTVTSTLDALDDLDDVYAIDLVAGQSIQVTMTADATTTDFDLRLFKPGTETIYGNEAFVASSVSSGYPEVLTYEAGVTNKFFLDVSAYAGAGEYQLQWEKGAAATQVTFGGPSTCVYAGSAVMTGTVSRVVDKAVLASKTVKVQALPYGSKTWTTVTQATTDEFGRFKATVRPTRQTVYRVLFDGDRDYKPAESLGRMVTPRAYLSAPSAPSSVAKGTYFTSSGFLKPRHTQGQRTVKIVGYRYESGKWVARKTVYGLNYNYSTYTRYIVRFSLPSAGKWKLVGSVSGDTLHAPTNTSPRYVTVK